MKIYLFRMQVLVFGIFSENSKKENNLKVVLAKCTILA